MDNNTEQDTTCLPEPLTRKNADGEIYQRESVVDRQIQEALILDAEELVRRSKVTDKVSREFFKEESLVYLIRHYHKVENRGLVDALTESLLSRCATWINGQLYRLGSDAAKEGYSEVVAELFGRILELGSDKGDFLQVRFWVVLKRLTVQAFDNQLNQLNLECAGAPLTSLEGYDDEDTGTLTHEDRLQASNTFTTRTIESEVIDKILIQAALSQLKEPFRSAYLLRYYWGWPIEDQSPSVQTISRHFKKTPRTIRNWITEAEERLEVWRKEKRDE